MGESMTLTERADLIESGALVWVQGTPSGPRECCLAWDAEGEAVDEDDYPPYWALTDEQAQAIGFVLDIPPGVAMLFCHAVIADWNDAPGRTKEEVVALLRWADG